jgi:hypothetical protein
MPALVLRADVADRPERWDPVARIPFGKRRTELGYRTFTELPASQPSSFAVAQDGSFWIDDRWKRRVVRYSSTGEFLGEATGLDRPGWDLAVDDGEVHVLVEMATGSIGTVVGDHVNQVDVTFQGQPLFVVQVMPTVVGLVAQAAVVPGQNAGELGTFALLRPGDSEVQAILPGLPLGRGDLWFDAVRSEHPAHPGGDQDFDLRFSSTEYSSVQPVQFELIAHDGTRTLSVPAQVGLGEPLPVGENVLLYASIAPTRPRDAERYGGGHWLFRIGRSAMLWERVADPGISSELQHRHLAVGPDGAIYLMVADGSGVTIFRRAEAG